MPKDMPLEVDGIICVSAGTNNNIVIKLHEMVNDNVDNFSISESESVEETTLVPVCNKYSLCDLCHSFLSLFINYILHKFKCVLNSNLHMCDQ